MYASHLHDYQLSTIMADENGGGGLFAVGHRKTFPQTQVVKVVNPVTCEEIADGDVGELWLSGPSITGRYFGKHELTSQKGSGSLGHFYVFFWLGNAMK